MVGERTPYAPSGCRKWKNNSSGQPVRRAPAPERLGVVTGSRPRREDLGVKAGLPPVSPIRCYLSGTSDLPRVDPVLVRRTTSSMSRYFKFNLAGIGSSRCANRVCTLFSHIHVHPSRYQRRVRSRVKHGQYENACHPPQTPRYKQADSISIPNFLEPLGSLVICGPSSHAETPSRRRSTPPSSR